MTLTNHHIFVNDCDSALKPVKTVKTTEKKVTAT